MLGAYISGGITLVIYILEFVFAYTENQKVRKSIKPFCLIGLITVIAFLKCNNILVYLALLFGLIGDILLIFDESKWCFLFGILAFFINHVLYIIVFSSLLSYSIKVWVPIVLTIFGLLVPFITYRGLYPYTKKFTIPGTLYFYILFMECLFAMMLLVDSKSPFAWMVLIGNIIFIISDTTLSLTHFFIEIKRRDFYIMITYLIAQTLISIGLCFLI